MRFQLILFDIFDLACCSKMEEVLYMLERTLSNLP